MRGGWWGGGGIVGGWALRKGRWVDDDISRNIKANKQ